MTVPLADAHAAQGLLQVVAGYWWLIVIFGGAVLDWIGEQFGMGMVALRRRRHERRSHELELKQLDLRIAQARAGQAAPGTAGPGLCRHRKAVPVRTSAGDVVAWLCPSCDTKLPKEFSIYEEDL